ncbi:MAG: NAD-dependent epimerase/dehydratase family protein [Candidatus Hodarchaeales archaeon]|jgi:nucleoside-diphosphate-sugar epimerase
MAQPKISLFGKGFVGGEFYNQFKKQVAVQERNNLVSQTPEIINFISTVHNYNVYTDPYIDTETNILLLIRMLENARAVFGQDVEFNHISSWFVIGDALTPVIEDTQCNPKGFYSITKYSSEMLLRSYCETYGMKFRILRLANVLGKKDAKVSLQKNFTQHLIKMLLNNDPVTVYYKGDFFRDYIDVRDCARAIKLVMDKGVQNQIYHISNGIPIRFSDVVEFLVNATGSKSEITYVNDVPFHQQVQTRSMYLNNKKLRLLGYKPKYTIFQTLQEIVDDYRSKS